MQKLSALSIALLSFNFVVGCGAADDQTGPASNGNETYGTELGNPSTGSTSDDSPSATTDQNPTLPQNGDPTNETPSEPGSEAPGSEDPPTEQPPVKTADPGPAPTEQCSVQKDGAGFFTRKSSKSEYVAYVPASYSPDKPMRVIVGLHGCSDNAMNFATWGVNPYDGRKTQTHIGISVSGETGNNKCWSMGNDDDKVLAAVEDLAKCFWLDRSKVVIAGYSSGGQLAYRVGMRNASKFAGILIENSALYAAGLPVDQLLSGAAHKLPIAHRAHTSDSVFPIAKVKADWTLTTAAGFPLTTSEVAGSHNGASEDWVNWLIPQSVSWQLPAN